MNDVCIVIIARSEHVRGLRKRLGNDPAVALFSECEALHAREAILARPPRILALDPTFVTTARGAALVAQVKTDARFEGLDLRVLSQDEDKFLLILAKHRKKSAEALLARTSQALDHCGTRREARFPMKGPVGVVVNGELSQLIDLSVMGAQLLVPARIRPEQSLRVTLIDGSAETRLNAVVAWSSAEVAGAAVWYRAGVTFLDPDTPILEAFCVRHGTTPDLIFTGA